MTTFTAAKPDGGDTIASSDTVIRDNFTVLKDHFDVQHVFSLTEAAGYGVHDATLLSHYVGTLTRALNGAPGAVATTGVGFAPKVILFFATAVGASADDITSQGGYDGTNNACAYSYATSVTRITGTSATKCIFLSDGGFATKYQTASVTATGADGFTLTWETDGMTSSNTAKIFFVCLRFS